MIGASKKCGRWDLERSVRIVNGPWMAKVAIDLVPQAECMTIHGRNEGSSEAEQLMRKGPRSRRSSLSTAVDGIRIHHPGLCALAVSGRD